MSSIQITHSPSTLETRPRKALSPIHPKMFQIASQTRQRLSSTNSSPNLTASESSSRDSLIWTDSSSDSEGPGTPTTADGPPFPDDASTIFNDNHVAEVDMTKHANQERASTKLVTQDPELLERIVSDGESGTQLIRKYCCGGGCCFLSKSAPDSTSDTFVPLDLPDNEAFKSLQLKIDNISKDTELTNITQLPTSHISFAPLDKEVASKHTSTVATHPPHFVQPHPPYNVFAAPLYHARELTKPGAEKRTFHFDIDVTDYPAEGDVDFKVGGAIGICPPNKAQDVDDIFDCLGIPSFVRDKPVLLQTGKTRWPTIWGDEQARSLITTRRELLTWCSDIQSYPPTKALLRLLAEHATDATERHVLLLLSSAEGQPAFCELRTGPHISLLQLLNSFPSARPPLPELLSVQQQLMPRFYSLSNDPHVSSDREGLAGRRLIEVAVTIHETPNWRGGPRTGVGSGFLERIAHAFIEAEASAKTANLNTFTHGLRIPMFRGLMANPLSKQFQGSSDGPMMLIGAGVGMAPFRGFILNRLRNANCASKIWLVQGVRDAKVDELYSGELGKYEAQIKKVVQSRAGRHLRQPIRASSERDLPTLRKTALRRESDAQTKAMAEAEKEKEGPKHAGESRYVQDEVRQQADIVWDVINAVDGRVFVCGSSKGMGEGVEAALCEVAVVKGKMSEEGAKRFWNEMKEAGKYIAETW